jgi:hypothetical protein
MDVDVDRNDFDGDGMPYQITALVISLMGECCPFADLAPLRMVCKTWRDLIDSCGLTTAKTDVCDSLAESCTRLRETVDAIKKAPNRSTNDISRMELMEDTLKHTDRVMDKHWPPTCSNSREELQMMARLARQFGGTADLVSGISTGNERITQNFDFADMGLRRRVNEVATCSGPIASDCIKDAHHREIWDRTFGPGTGEVSWEDFCDRFVGSAVLSNKPVQFAAHLKALMCFPEEKTVTPYAVHILSAMYGPGPEMWTVYSNLMLGHGFVGLVNLVHAREMFLEVRNRLRRGSYVLRYSRALPDVFTITTYNPVNGEIAHIRNILPTLTLPELLLKMTRSGWDMAMFSMDGTIYTSSALTCSRVDRPMYISDY